MLCSHTPLNCKLMSMSMIQKHSFSITSCNKDHGRAWEAPKVYSFTSPLTSPSVCLFQPDLYIYRKYCPREPSYSPRPLRVFCEWVRFEKNPGGHMKAVFPRLFELYNVQLPEIKVNNVNKNSKRKWRDGNNTLNANLRIIYVYNINHLKCMHGWLSESCVSIHTLMCEND